MHWWSATCWLLLPLLLLLLTTSAETGHIRFPSSSADDDSAGPTILKIEPCPESATSSAPCAANVRPVDVADQEETVEAVLWSRYNLSSTTTSDLLEAASGDHQVAALAAASSTEEMQLVPVQVPNEGSGGPEDSPEELISENEVMLLRNQYRWIMDKPATWRKRYLNETHENSNALVEAFKNKTKPLKSLTYEGQKGFQNEFLDILGKGKRRSANRCIRMCSGFFKGRATSLHFPAGSRYKIYNRRW